MTIIDRAFFALMKIYDVDSSGKLPKQVQKDISKLDQEDYYEHARSFGLAFIHTLEAMADEGRIAL